MELVNKNNLSKAKLKQKIHNKGIDKETQKQKKSKGNYDIKTYAV